MKIQVERIHRLEGTGSLKGFADVSVEDSFLIKGLRIVAGEDGLFVAMPQKLGANGKSYSCVGLLKKEIKEQIADLVLSAYEE